uniref:Internal scaffolding protein n=1 Tax=Dulem virus 245 TaxID=3145722 RepID=A0AAU8B0T7_9VIRU
MKEKEKKAQRFGPGYKPFISIREVQVCPICASPEPDICLEELPTEAFRFERCGEPDDPDCLIRIRSDVSMLLHAADMAKKYGSNFVQSMIDSKRPKSSHIQEFMDKMSDAQILDTVKSRHLQSPSELLAWSEYLMDQARSIEREVERLALEKASAEAASSAESETVESQSE